MPDSAKSDANWLGLAGRNAVVTGAASGIGRASALALAQAGVTVLATDRDAAGLAETAATNIANGEVRTFTQDVTDAAAWTRLGATIAQDYGRLDILVNAAGVALGDTAGTDELETYRRTFAINVEGALLGMGMALKFMEPAGRGAIVNIASSASFKGNPLMASYGASKAALAHFTRSAALRLARGKGEIRINSLHPGLIETPMKDALFGVLGQVMSEEQMLKATSTGRLGRPEEMADTILFLVSDRASFISGANIAADRGQSA